MKLFPIYIPGRTIFRFFGSGGGSSSRDSIAILQSPTGARSEYLPSFPMSPEPVRPDPCTKVMRPTISGVPIKDSCPDTGAVGYFSPQPITHRQSPRQTRPTADVLIGPILSLPLTGTGTLGAAGRCSDPGCPLFV